MKVRKQSHDNPELLNYSHVFISLLSEVFVISDVMQSLYSVLKIFYAECRMQNAACSSLLLVN